MEVIYIAGGCLWGVEAFVQTLPGVIQTEAGRANGTTTSLDSPYDGYAECVKTTFDPSITSVDNLMNYFFEIIDPYSMNKQGIDVGEKYRTGIYSEVTAHLEEAKAFISKRDDVDRIAVEVMPLSNYIASAEEHQDHLTKFPNDYCHIPKNIMNKYKKQTI